MASVVSALRLRERMRDLRQREAEAQRDRRKDRDRETETEEGREMSTHIVNLYQTGVLSFKEETLPLKHIYIYIYKKD